MTALVQAALDQGPHAFGLPAKAWTLRGLRALLLRECGLTVSSCTLHRFVHAVGYRFRRPRHDLRLRQDTQAVAAAQRMLEWLHKSLFRPGRSAAAVPHLVYVDKCEIQTHRHLAQVWRKKGQPMRTSAAGTDQKCTIFGALDYASGRIVHPVSACKGEDVFTAFLEQLPRTTPSDEALGVVLDHAG